MQATIQRIIKHSKQLDFINVTDCALAKLRAGALPFAAIIKQQTGKEPLVNVSCRDRNVMALQADLMGAWMQGVQSIVALTGDAMSVGDTPERQGVFEVNSIGLLQIINSLNQSKDLEGKEIKGATSFVPGVVANPNAKNLSVELRRLEKKRAAGASYVLTQPVYDHARAAEFCSAANAMGIAVFLGLMPVKNQAGLKGLCSIPGVKIPEALTAQWSSLSDDGLRSATVDFCLQQAELCLKDCAGFHVVAGASPQLAFELLVKLDAWRTARCQNQARACQS